MSQNNAKKSHYPSLISDGQIAHILRPKWIWLLHIIFSRLENCFPSFSRILKCGTPIKLLIFGYTMESECLPYSLSLSRLHHRPLIPASYKPLSIIS